MLSKRWAAPKSDFSYRGNIFGGGICHANTLPLLQNARLKRMQCNQATGSRLGSRRKEGRAPYGGET
ncbi:MAG: hypothetical protein PHT62_13110 [Desulfotomaculaceae bacterium]|nr:hypothetical protein [Desulfotomaculaceae bacterium]